MSIIWPSYLRVLVEKTQEILRVDHKRADNDWTQNAKQHRCCIDIHTTITLIHAHASNGDIGPINNILKDIFCIFAGLVSLVQIAE